MDIQQCVNLEIMTELRKRGIAFALPTRTLHVAGLSDHVDSLGDAKPRMQTRTQAFEVTTNESP
jgi:hypothetical protein